MSPAEREMLPDLSAYLDGELDAARAREIDEMLPRSATLRAVLEEIRSVSSQLRQLPRRSAPPELGERLRLAGLASAARPPGATGWGRALRFARAALLSAAMILVGFVAARLFDPRSAVAPLPASQSQDLIVSRRLQAPMGGAAIQPPEPANERAAPEMARTATPAPAGSSEAPVDGIASKSLTLGALEYLVARLANSSDAAPDVEITIQPREPETYGYALDLLSTYGFPAQDLTLSAQRLGQAREGPQGVEIELDTPAEELGALLATLEQQSPGQVQVRLEFSASQLGQVQGLLAAAPPPAPAMTAQQPVLSKELPSGGGGEKFETRLGVTPSVSRNPRRLDAAPETATARPAPAADRRPSMPDEVTREEVRRLREMVNGRAAGSRPAEVAEGLGPEAASRRLGYADASESASRSADPAQSEEAMARVVASLIQTTRAGVSGLLEEARDRMRDLAQSPPAESPPVRLRVRVLPPPQTSKPSEGD